MITFKQQGDFKKTRDFLTRAQRAKFKPLLDLYGKVGVIQLAKNTPTDTGKTASSWYYELEAKKGYVSIVWKNSNIVDGVPIAVILQYGHGTKNGGYVQGRDYINPAIQPVFDDIVDVIWKEITKQ